jgi:hypothetical protein
MAANDPAVSASLQTPQTQPQFEGSHPVAFRIDPDGRLQPSNAPLSGGSIFPTGSTPLATVGPLRFNGPDFFKNQSKPIAYCKIGVTQTHALQPMSKQLSWSIIYSLITAQDQDLQDTDFQLPDDDVDKLSRIPLPGGAGSLTCVVTAIVGGELSKGLSILFGTFNKLQSIAGGAVSKGLLTIPAVPLSVVTQIESMLVQVAQTFMPGQESQYWMNGSTINLVCNAAGTSTRSGGAPGPQGADFSQLRLAQGANTIVIVPTRGNKGDGNTQNNVVVDYFQDLQKYVGSQKYLFAVDPDGVISLTSVSNEANPFAQIPYVTMNIQIDNMPAQGADA